MTTLGTSVRIAAWNVNHRTLERTVTDRFTRALLGLDSDVIVLTEYVSAPQHEALYSDLQRAGYVSQFMTPRCKSQNQVFIASRIPTERGALTAAESPPPGSQNFLHVYCPDLDIDIIGIRVPAYTDGRSTRAYWMWLETFLTEVPISRRVVIGDFNTDRDRADFAGRAFARITARWAIAGPGGAWSFAGHSGNTSKIDHALGSPGVQIHDARYVTQAGGIQLVSQEGKALSDHAALVIEVA